MNLKLSLALKPYDRNLPLITGEVKPDGIDREYAAIDESDIVPLFPDPRAEAIRYYQKTGIFPPHHTTVVRESVLDEHAWVALSLFEAFQEPKRLAMERLNQQPPSPFVFGEQYLREVTGISGSDPYRYGVNANAKAVDALQTFSVEQELTEKKQPFEDLYPQEILYLEERA